MPSLKLRALSAQIFAAQLGILLVTVLIGFALFARQERSALDAQYEQRAASIAQTVAGVPDIVACMAGDTAHCHETVQAVASRIQTETGAAYVVVIDMHQVRHSHPIASLIGQRVTEPIVTRDGKTHVGIDNGATGRSANGKAPLYAANGRMVGEVSVGLREQSVSTAFRNELPTYAGWFLIALLVGGIASWLLARRLKRRTFGLELDEIARLLQEREATLHGIREGVVAFDESGSITMVNDEARRLLALNGTPVGGRLEDLVPPGRLRDVLTGDVVGQDEVVLTDDFALTVNRMPVRLAGRPHGAVVTLRDRTEMSGLLRELDGVRSLTDSLRAQQHEFTNRMHTLVGLLELGDPDEALAYLTEVRDHQSEFADALRSRVSSNLVVGLLLGKAAEASERGIALELTDDSWLGETPEKVQALTTIIGNLIDNALDALHGAPGERRIVVRIVEDEHTIELSVRDNGPGVQAAFADAIFTDGFSTKAEAGSGRRGLGLALVHRLVQRLHGSISVSEPPGATFTVHLPKDAAAVPPPALRVP